MQRNEAIDLRQNLCRLRETLWLEYVQKCKGHANNLSFSDWALLQCTHITDEIDELNRQLSQRT